MPNKYNMRKNTNFYVADWIFGVHFKALVCQINSVVWVTHCLGCGSGWAELHKIQFLKSTVCFCVLLLNKTALISLQTQLCGFWNRRLTKTTCSRGQKQHVTKCWYVMRRCENGLEPIINQGLLKQIERVVCFQRHLWCFNMTQRFGTKGGRGRLT